MKLLVPVKFNDVLKAVKIAPPYFAELLMKLPVPVKLRDVLQFAAIAPCTLAHTIHCTHSPNTYLSISAFLVMLVTAAMYLMMILEASVLPAPLSPEGGRCEGEGVKGQGVRERV